MYLQFQGHREQQAHLYPVLCGFLVAEDMMGAPEIKAFHYVEQILYRNQAWENSDSRSSVIEYLQQTLACSILTALLSEFSSSSKTSNIGLSMEFHGNCKRVFQVLLFLFLCFNH